MESLFQRVMSLKRNAVFQNHAWLAKTIRKDEARLSQIVHVL